MSATYDSVLKANDHYAANFGDKGKLTMPPVRRFAILTCMDARLDPAKYAGLAEGDAHVIRNAGGRASDDAIRSLVISHKLLATNEWFVVHHTDCGMLTFTNEVMSDLLDDNLETASFDGKKWSNAKHGGGNVCQPSGAGGNDDRWATGAAGTFDPGEAGRDVDAAVPSEPDRDLRARVPGQPARTGRRST